MTRQCGGSDAERYINCTAAKALCALLPDEPSLPALTGTALHAVMHDISLSPDNPADVVGDVVDITESGKTYEIAMTAELIMDKLAPVYDWHLKQPPGALYEQRVAFNPRELPGFSGTADRLHPESGECIDYKFGAVFVDASSVQALFYLSAALDCGVLGVMKTYSAVIVQPQDGTLEPRTVEYSHRDLLQFKDVLKAAYKNHLYFDAIVAETPGELYNPAYYSEGPQCQFCLGKASCPLKVKSAIDLLAPLDLSEVAPEKINASEVLTAADNLDEIYLISKRLKSWTAAVDKEVKKRFADGNPVPGLKKVASRHKYSFADPDAVEKLIAKGYPAKSVDPKSPRKTVKNWGLNENLLNMEPTAYTFVKDDETFPEELTALGKDLLNFKLDLD